MKIITAVLIFLLTTSLAFPQRQETIDSDRPGQSMNPHTVGKNVLQVQTGVSYYYLKSTPKSSYNGVDNETNLRYGLIDILEINGTIGYRFNSYKHSGRYDYTSNGAEKLRIGVRLNILDHDGLTPSIGASAELLVPFKTDVYYMTDNGFEGTISIKQPITKEWSVTGNIGIFDNPASVIFFYPYTLNTSYSLTKDLSAFVEVFGLLHKVISSNYGYYDKRDMSYDAGISYLLNNDLLLDFSFGNDNSYIENSWFMNAGVSFRFGGEK